MGGRRGVVRVLQEVQVLQVVVVPVLLVLVLAPAPALGISCYQCSGTDNTDPFLCNEFLENDEDLAPHDCSQIHAASYCIKHIGRFEGGIGTKRYCSPLDLGNYCNYVKNVGDDLEYRSCVFTCGTDGCNSSTLVTPVRSFLAVATLVLFYFF